MRFVLLFSLLTLSFSGLATAKGKLSLDDLQGRYKLLKASYGLCDESLQVLVSKSLNKHDNDSVRVDAGSFGFPCVDAGRQSYEDDYSSSWTESVLGESSLSFTAKTFVKPIQETQLESVVLELSDGRLHIVSDSDFYAEGGESGASYTECEYQFVEKIPGNDLGR